MYHFWKIAQNVFLADIPTFQAKGTGMDSRDRQVLRIWRKTADRKDPIETKFPSIHGLSL